MVTQHKLGSFVPDKRRRSINKDTYDPSGIRLKGNVHISQTGVQFNQKGTTCQSLCDVHALRANNEALYGGHTSGLPK